MIKRRNSNYHSLLLTYLNKIIEYLFYLQVCGKILLKYNYFVVCCGGVKDRDFIN